ncbi:cysteine protease StiP family protein [uncultured Clostridium sp.]|uniref:cysteine protease StiP family protein n=1 Tax=uncultured Clostridium sp. TaxID=59620 RepID=UPI0025FE4359|nr:cysteine protease StiP family protein [uncultured Clostridium sp.]
MICNKEFSTYSKEDVIFLLKDISDVKLEQGNAERERAIQNGRHYSEMLPIEYQVSDQYLNLYREKLELYKEKLAYCVGVMSEKILKLKGEDVVLVSLARAGTPIGILAKRYIKERYNLNLPHYTISIIRDKGIDENAVNYILEHHRGMKIQFIDGWTGKGTICNVLKEACDTLHEKYGIKLDDSLAVLADPAGYSNAYGVREDFLIPSACLNSTVSGLVSRTVLRSDLIGKDDFHGAKYYKELKAFDESNKYIDTISEEFKNKYSNIDNYMSSWNEDKITKLGTDDVNSVRADFDINDINFIKPGIGETTRVLLRRIPYKILVKSLEDEELNHIFVLAKEKGVQVEEYPLQAYKCCGIIKNMKDI